jgi:hypothetical protein
MTISFQSLLIVASLYSPQLNNLTHQHNTVVEDYANTQKKYDQLSALYEETKQTLALHQGDKVALKGCHSISKLEEIEISLRLALECVEYRKVSDRSFICELISCHRMNMIRLGSSGER